MRHLILLLALALTNHAQDRGTCRCCELGRIHAPYLKNLPTPKKRTNIGNSHLKITTSSEAAQQWFDQGLNLLHAFWEFEAYRCFLQTAKEDPNCAMAYWGICMSLPGKNAESAKERKAALDLAQQLAANPDLGVTDHEKLYIEMVESLIQFGSKATLPRLRNIIAKHPGDIDATAFLALWLGDGYKPNGKPKPDTAEAIALLTEALKKHPTHTGLNHYYIHLLEQGPDFEQARDAAISLPKAAPGAGHLVHMPGHIHYLAGEYENACKAFRDCDKIETSYLKSEGIPAVDNNNYLHNLHFLAFAAADQGRYQEALIAANRLAEIKIPAFRNKAIGAHQIHYLSNTIIAQIHMRAGHYDLAAASLLPNAVPNNSGAHHYILFLRSYCRLRHTIAQPQNTHTNATILQEKIALSRHLKNLKVTNPGNTPETQPWSQAHTAGEILLNEARAWIENIQPNKKFKKTWANIALRASQRSDYTEPPLLLTPVEESLGHLALHSGHPTLARKYFLASLQKRRQSGHAYLGIARSYRRENNPPKASEFYKKFLTSFLLADQSRPQLEEARNYLELHQKNQSTHDQ